MERQMRMAEQKQEPAAAGGAARTGDPKHARLEKLVGELLETNQELRFKVAQLEQKAASLERGLAQSCAGAGMLWP
jgi:hypothetical protein